MNSSPDIGYCCNVHPGIGLAEVKSNLLKHAVQVREQVANEENLPIGLWLSSTAASELADPEAVSGFKAFLEQQRLLPFTINGFPFGDFHQPVVKHAVYRPTWADERRLRYTLELARILDALLPPERLGTISTLPIGWPIGVDYGQQVDQPTKFSSIDPGLLHLSAANLRHCATELARLESETGRQIVVCLEPEPGCLLDCAADVQFFFETFLFSQPDQEATIRRHIGICHDICHSAVMFESQAEAIRTYRDLGLTVGKVQVSSAIDIDFDNLLPTDAQQAVQQLAAFNEPKYLHQTTCRFGDRVRFFEDLDQALRELGEAPSGHCRVHFHVPIFSERLGAVTTSQPAIRECLRAIEDYNLEVPHFEIETYAWNVIPPALRGASLAEDLAREINWLRDCIA